MFFPYNGGRFFTSMILLEENQWVGTYSRTSRREGIFANQKPMVFQLSELRRFLDEIGTLFFEARTVV